MSVGDSGVERNAAFSIILTLIANEIVLRRILLEKHCLKELTPPALGTMHSKKWSEPDKANRN